MKSFYLFCCTAIIFSFGDSAQAAHCWGDEDLNFAAEQLDVSPNQLTAWQKNAVELIVHKKDRLHYSTGFIFNSSEFPDLQKNTLYIAANKHALIDGDSLQIKIDALSSVPINNIKIIRDGEGLDIMILALTYSPQNSKALEGYGLKLISDSKEVPLKSKVAMLPACGRYKSFLTRDNHKLAAVGPIHRKGSPQKWGDTLVANCVNTEGYSGSAALNNIGEVVGIFAADSTFTDHETESIFVESIFLTTHEVRKVIRSLEVAAQDITTWNRRIKSTWHGKYFRARRGLYSKLDHMEKPDDEILAMFDEVIAEKPDFFPAQYDKALMWFYVARAGRIPSATLKAAGLFDQLNRILPNDLEVMYHLIYSHILAGKTSGDSKHITFALSELDRASSLFPYLPGLETFRAIAAEK